ncbi:MAG TPA: class D sortase [Thermoanaerobaculia bacterium]
MKSATSAKRAHLRWIERALLLVGLVCLGAYAYAWADAKYTQYKEEKLLEEALAHQQARVTPASESDSLGTFQEARLPEPPREPGPQGSLVGRIEIPRVGVSAIVLEGVDKKTLRRGVGRIPGTSIPGKDGNIGLAAHRDSFFRGLRDIRKNDIVTLKTVEGTYNYQVEWTEVVQPQDTHVLDETDGPAITLVTCYPFSYVGPAPKRFIVRAHRIEEGSNTEAVSGVQ